MAAKKAAESVPKALAEEVRRWGAMKRNGVSLRYMMEFGARPTPTNLLLSAQFLHKELSARIARRAIELESLPLGLSGKPAVLKIYVPEEIVAPIWLSFYSDLSEHCRLIEDNFEGG
ncbi:hypothetical protein BHE74_00052247 [Ensete ventricosum]|nr:hypothetical protein BHE74_00052247 [Ensete ventricosum]